MEDVICNLEKHVQKTDEKLDSLALKVGNVERQVFQDDTEVEVFRLLKSVSEVKSDYQNLRKEIMEVQQLQRQLSNSLRSQLNLVKGHLFLLRGRIAWSNPDAGKE